MSLQAKTVYLPNKRPSDLLDYNVDFASYLPSGSVALDSVDVEVTASGTGESPLELAIVGDPTISVNRDGLSSLCIFWLSAGTPKTRYRLTVTASDNQHTDPDRSYSILAEIYITGA